MGFTKITNTELNSRGATTLPNQPTISATALKQEFDAPAKNVVAPKVNNLIDELEASTSATSLGATAPTGFTGSTVQAVLNSIGATASSASSQAHSHSNKAVIDKFSEDSGGNPLYDGNPIVSGGGEWGTITGDIDDQTDLANALSAKADSSSLASVATSGLYSDLSGTPSLATVATSGSYSDLSNKPTIPAVDQAYNSASTNAQSGTAVAGAIATKSAVAWSQTITTGQKIATVTIDGTPTDVYAPTGGGGGGGGAVDSVNGQTGTVVLDVDDINDVTIASIADQDTLVYNGTTHTWGNEPLADVALTGAYSSLSGTPTLATVATTGLYSDLSGTPTIPAAQIQSDWTQADNTKKDYIKNKPTIPTNLNSLSDVTVSSPSSDQVLKYNGSGWVNGAAPASGHTMTPTPGAGVNEASIVSAIGTAVTEGGVNDDVVSAYGVGKWTNVKTFRRVALGSDGDIHATGIGTWTDADPSSITTADEATWWEDEAFYIPSSGVDPDSVEIKFLFEPLADGTPIALGGYLWDTDYVHDNTHYGRICIKFANDITGYTSTAKVAVDITYTRNEVV